VTEEVAVELLKCFYKQCTDFTASDPSRIKHIIERDSFGLGVRLADVPVKAFTVRVYARAQRQRDLLSDFALLLHPQQEWAKSFRLFILVEKAVRKNEDNIAEIVDDVWFTVQALQPILRVVKERGGVSDIELRVEEALVRESRTLNVGNMMEDGHQVWEKAVETVVEDMWKRASAWTFSTRPPGM
jgi:hypothetical protein